MLESIIQFLNLELSLLNYFEKRHCLSTLVTTDKGEVYPAEYLGQGNYDKIDFDAFDGVSYFRLIGEPNIERIDQKYTPKPRVNVTFPLKLVYAVRKSKLSQDDAYSFDRVRTSIAKQLESDAKDLVATLKADRIEINTSNYNFNPKDVWDEETAETGQYQPRMDFIFASMDVDVVVTIKNECIAGECDGVSSDILQAIDFCLKENIERLTAQQIACLESEICSPCADATVELNGTEVGTIASGGAESFAVTQDGSPVGSWNGTEFVIPSCPASASLSVSFSNTSPLFGDSVTITITTTGITPTSHTFWIPKNDGSYEKIIQASNTYIWTVDAVGSIVVYVASTDGTTVAYDEDGTTINVSEDFSDYGTPLSICSVLNDVDGFSGAIAYVRRSSDNADDDFFPDANGELSMLSENASGTTLGSFVSGTDFFGYFYDKSGNSNHFTIANASYQPKLGTAGVINTVNGKVVFNFDGVDDTLSSPNLDGYSGLDVYFLIKGYYTDNGMHTSNVDSSGYAFLIQPNNNAAVTNNAGSPSLTSDIVNISDNTRYGTFALTINETQQVLLLSDLNTSSWNGFFILGYRGIPTTYNVKADLQGVYVFQSGSNKEAIKAIINKHK
jgi:hypothetical protein